MVDDDPDTVFSTALLLRTRGYEVYTAGDGLEALELVSAKEPHVIILDLAMPRLSGIELTAQIRAQALYRRPFLIAITGLTSFEERERALAAGVDLLFVKPVAFDAIERVLNRFATLLDIESEKTSQAARELGNRAELSARILECSQPRQIHCCLCRRPWQQSSIRIVLTKGQATLGDLCPACLSSKPQELASQIEREAHLLAVQFSQLQSCVLLKRTSERSLPKDPVELGAAVAAVRQQSQRLRTVCREIREQSARFRAMSEHTRLEIIALREKQVKLIQEGRRLMDQAPQEALLPPAEISDAVEEFAGVLIFADHLRHPMAWPISVQDVIEEEKRALTKRFHEMSADDLQRLVDRRYEEFLRESA
jgi:CheY-like chemotaxis protein